MGGKSEGYKRGLCHDYEGYTQELTTSISKHTVWQCCVVVNAPTSPMAARVRVILCLVGHISNCPRSAVIMPPSALANLTSLDLESPWMFQLRNPSNPAASTHAGVLEFIAEEGIVYLPYWMMKTLRLEEGDPVRITGAELPKGKLVKLQAQSVHFLEISDPRAVYVIPQYLPICLFTFYCRQIGASPPQFLCPD